MTDIPVPGAPQPEEAQIYDRGYRTFEGERTGVPGAIRTLVVHSMRTALGLGRSAKHKVVPVLIILIAYIPAIIFIGLAALLPGEELEETLIPSFPEFYSGTIVAIYLFAGFVAPSLLCTDRRTGMLGVYLSSPLDRVTYLLGKAIAVFIVLLLVIFGPPLLLLIALTLEGSGPDSLGAWIETFGKIFLGSIVMGTFFAAIGLAVAAATDRIVVATATVLAIIPASAIAVGLLVDENDLSPSLRLLSLPTLPRELIFRIHGESDGPWSITANPTWTLWAGWGAWMIVAIGFIWFSYRRLLVRR